MFESSEHTVRRASEGLLESAAHADVPASSDTPAIKLTPQLREQAVKMARSRIGEFFIQKYDLIGPSYLSTAVNLHKGNLSRIFKDGDPAPLSWALRAAIAVPDLPIELLCLSVEERFRDDFLVGLSRLTGKDLADTDIKRRLAEEALAVKSMEENPFQRARRENFVGKNSPRSKLTDSWLWQRRAGFKLLLKKTGMSVESFNQVLGFSPQDLKDFLNGNKNLLVRDVRRLWRETGRVEPTTIMFFGVPHAVKAQVRIFKERYKVNISTAKIAHRLAHAESKIKQGQEPPGFVKMGLRNIIGPERDIDWESAKKRVAELGEKSNLISALRRSEADEEIKRADPTEGEASQALIELTHARYAAACSLARKEKVLTRDELIAKFDTSGPTLTKLLSCNKSLSVSEALALAQVFPDLSDSEIAVFVWPSHRAELLKKLSGKWGKRSLDALNKEISALASEISSDPAKQLAEVQAQNRRLTSAPSAADIVKRGLFFIDAFEYFETQDRRAITQAMGLKTSVTEYIAGKLNFDTKPAIELFERLPFDAYQYALAFVSASQKPLIRERLGDRLVSQTEQAVDNKVERILTALGGSAKEFSEFLKTIARKTEKASMRVLGRSLELRKGVFVLKQRAANSEHVFPEDWEVSTKGLEAVRSGRRVLTLGQVLRIIAYETDIPPESFYFCLDREKQPLFAPLAEAVCGVKINEGVIKQLEAGTLALEDIREGLRDDAEQQRKLQQNIHEFVRDKCVGEIVDHMYGHRSIEVIARRTWGFNHLAQQEFKRTGWLSAERGLQAAAKRGTYPSVEHLFFLVHPDHRNDFARLIFDRLKISLNQEVLKRIWTEAGGKL